MGVTEPSGVPSPNGATTTATGLRPTRAERRNEELLAAERTLVTVRWFAVPFAVLQVLVYENMPYPDGVQEAGFALAGVLALLNLAVVVALRRVSSDRGVLALSAATLVADTAVVMGFVWLYTFDNESVFFLLLFILPAEAALKFQLRGAVGLWATVTALYVAREVWGAARYGFEVSEPSISFRMGILLLVSLIVGMFARSLGRRSDQLATALDDLEREEQWRSALIDMLAHDFRAPVGSATSGLLLVSRRMDELPAERLRPLVDAAVRQNRRALALADDVLTLARTGHGRLQLSRQDVEVAALLDRVVDWLGAHDAVCVTCSADLRAHVDPARLEQVVTNLVSNACRHGRPPVTVTASALPDRGLEVRVADGGDGVPEAQQDQMFSQFSSGPRADSVGLGLWLVSLLADAHGGDVRYLTVEGRPTFVVRLPGAGAEAEPVPAAAAAGGVRQSTRGRRPRG